MRISEVAEILGMPPKDVIQEVESLRDGLTNQGFKLAKKLTAASGLDDDAVRSLMAAIDERRQSARKAKEEEAREAQRAEDDKRRAEEAARRAVEEAVRREALEEARRKADEELARRRAEIARLAALEPPPAPVVVPAPVAPPPPPAAVAPPPPPPAAPTPVAAPPQAAAPSAPVAPTAAAQAPPSAMPPAAAAAPPASYTPRPGGPPSGPRPNIDRPRFEPRPGGPSSAGPRPGGPSADRFSDRGPRPPAPGAVGDRLDPRQDPSRFGPVVRTNPGERPGGPRRDGDRPMGGPGGPRRDGPSGPGGPRRDGDRSGPGGPRRDGGPSDRFSGPGGPRMGGGGRSDDGRRASAGDLQDFVNQGLGPSLADSEKKRGPARRDERGGPKGKVGERRGPAGETEAEAAARKRRLKGGEGDRQTFRPTQIFEGEVVTRRPGARPEKMRRGKPGQNQPQQVSRPIVPQGPKQVVMTGDFTVGAFADKLGVEVSEVMKKLLMMGEFLTINQILNPDLAELIATEFKIELVIKREGDEVDVEEFTEIVDDPETLRPRPPVVTVMGHVDHGKTTLLDAIRNTNVVDKEFGGITQHIGAYFVNTRKGDIAFLDTPGHEAFTAMRARGANATDLVILVVAANDGVKPQTVEAINHAKAANVPIIVAINKMDVQGANAIRVKQELMRYGLVSEDLGGDVMMIEVSALKGNNLQELLEMVALQAEVLELKANPDRDAVGTIVESHVDPLRGAVATLLVQAGTLRVGDIFVVGTEFGRVRAMRDDKGNTIEEAGPARPAEILGISGSPAAGERFVVVKDENTAREIAERRESRRKLRAARALPHVTLDNLKERLAEGSVKSLNLIVKGDVQGSIEAICASLLKIKSDRIILNILHSAVGAVSEGDIQLADASDAIVIAFNVRPDPVTRDLAAKLGVQIKMYNIIYDLLAEIESAMLGMLEPVFEEQPMGRATVRQVFRVSKVGNIAGCFVEEGTIGRDHKVRLVRGGTVVWNGAVKTLRRVKDDVKEVLSGLECGIGLANFNDVKEGDVIETFVLKQLEASLMSANPNTENK